MGKERPSRHTLFDAGRVAYEDFERIVDERLDSSSELSRHAADMKNYELVLRQDSEYYVVTLFLLPIPGGSIRGGGGQYKISKDDLSVVDFVGYK